MRACDCIHMWKHTEKEGIFNKMLYFICMCVKICVGVYIYAYICILKKEHLSVNRKPNIHKLSRKA